MSFETTRDGPYSTRDPRRAGIKAAIVQRLRDKMKLTIESSEPGCPGWRQNLTRSHLLHDLILEIEALNDE